VVLENGRKPDQIRLKKRGKRKKKNHPVARKTPTSDWGRIVSQSVARDRKMKQRGKRTFVTVAAEADERVSTPFLKFQMF